MQESRGLPQDVTRKAIALAITELGELTIKHRVSPAVTRRRQPDGFELADRAYYEEVAGTIVEMVEQGISAPELLITMLANSLERFEWAAWLSNRSNQFDAVGASAQAKLDLEGSEEIRARNARWLGLPLD